ncbi:pyocin activator PrtN family protein [Aquitalea magnusonii]|uniref:pyocin activator PrtN family protein n=1 Tax=Aquitalea magnusonii TaxID=332411 RepID=UPI000B5C888C|nr:pyocin activator PrtN family protein [Aquitalea magnusonii]
MKTLFLLMAQYEQPAIPLSAICELYFGLTAHEANRAAKLNRLPIPTFRVGTSQRAPRMVHVEDLAALIDKQRQAAMKSWLSSKA